MRRLFFVLFVLGMATSSHAAMDVTLSNTTDSAVTLACINEGTGTCRVNYGLSQGSLTLSAYDVRGSKTVSQIHYVSIDNLSPVTTYYYQLLIDNKLLSKGTFTTATAIIPQNSYLAYGQVFNGHKPAAGCMVSLWLEDGDGKGTKDKSNLSSCLTDENGYWFYDLVNLRTQDGKGLFDFSRQGDLLYLDVYAENGTEIKTRIDTGACMPARNLYLK
ncbi:fibronectin type III domain-containing protein [Candidatus Desantisbacteria bacterium]|nr:fibronectin type III domain-containing protein [Candidatus Desantisbacteria bacterium]